MSTCRLFRCCPILVVFCVVHAVFAAERVELISDTSAAKPAPPWVKMVDLGAKDPALKGYFAPDGVAVEVVATEPQTIDPVGMLFDDAGRMLVLEWREGKGDLFPALDEFEITYQDGTKKKRFRNRKSVRDELKLLEDKDGDGKYETAKVLLAHQTATMNLGDTMMRAGKLPASEWRHCISTGKTGTCLHSLAKAHRADKICIFLRKTGCF